MDHHVLAARWTGGGRFSGSGDFQRVSTVLAWQQEKGTQPFFQKTVVSGLIAGGRGAEESIQGSVHVLDFFGVCLGRPDEEHERSCTVLV